MTDHPPHALLIDFGSTYTKLRAVDLAQARIVASGQGPSTVASDVTIGMTQALADLERRMGRLPIFRHRLASSSAAGGLKMVTVGLVKELTAEAARVAALGAGAKLVGTYAYRLTKTDIEAILGQSPDILLLAGGTDGGNRDVVLHNAARLAASGLACPVIVACNRDVADEVGETLSGSGRKILVAGNVMPAYGVLDIEPARAAIRDIFIAHIVHAKGIDRAAAMFDAVLMPTPAAVLEGARLLADGTEAEDGLGALAVVDIGGATTDVHSIATGAPEGDGVTPLGLPEPYAKRTVEGDLGMRHNARTIVETVGLLAISRSSGLGESEVETLLGLIEADVERLPQTPEEAAFDAALAKGAVKLAMARHAGTTEIVQTVTGPVIVQRGKDLTTIGTLIGTGGAIVYADDPEAVISAALYDEAEAASLRPKSPALLIDRDYALFAVGLLGSVAPDAAVRLGRQALFDNKKDHAHEGHELQLRA